MRKTLYLLLVGLIVSTFAGTAASETVVKNPDVDEQPESQDGIVKWSFEIIEPDRTAKPGEWVQWQYQVKNSPDSTDTLVLSSLASSIPDGVDEHGWGKVEFPPVPLEPGESFEGNHVAWHIDYSAPTGMPIKGELDAVAPPPAMPSELSRSVSIDVEPLELGSIYGLVTDVDSGEPVEGASIIAIQRGTGWARERTDAKGSYQIPDLEPERWWLFCWKRGYKLGVKRVEVIPGGVTLCNFVLFPRED